MKNEARSTFRSDIALFLYVEPLIDATRFEANGNAAGPVRNLLLDEAARDGAGVAERAVAGGERRINSRT